MAINDTTINNEVDKIDVPGGAGAIRKAVLTAAKHMNDGFLGVIPSIQFINDDRVLVSAFLVTENLLCETRIIENGYNYDVVSLRSIGDYRVMSGITPRDGKDPLSYARVMFTHDDSVTHTQIEYVGNNVEGWINHVLELIPIKVAVGGMPRQ